MSVGVAATSPKRGEVRFGGRFSEDVGDCADLLTFSVCTCSAAASSATAMSDFYLLKGECLLRRELYVRSWPSTTSPLILRRSKARAHVYVPHWVTIRISITHAPELAMPTGTAASGPRYPTKGNPFGCNRANFDPAAATRRST